MNRQVLFRPLAEAELLESRAWYEERQPGLGATFAAVVESTVEQIAEWPLAYPRVHGETRRAMLRRFPYAVYFRALPSEIVILAIIHDRRHPRRWQSRS